jgi:predicted transcriptional regulator
MEWGTTLCSNGAINGAIDGRVTAPEFKLYILLLKYAFQKGSCYPSQITLSKELRVTQQAISLLLMELEKVEYIKKNTSYLKGAESLVYTLLV